jgi:hypothetical protein
MEGAMEDIFQGEAPFFLVGGMAIAGVLVMAGVACVIAGPVMRFSVIIAADKQRLIKNNEIWNSPRLKSCLPMIRR